MIPLPTWLLSKPALFVGGLLVVLGGVGLWDRTRTNRIKREAVAEQAGRAAREELVTAELRARIAEDSMLRMQAHVDSVTQTARSAGASYSEQRAKVNIRTPQPVGTPAGMILVPISFVERADSLLHRVEELIVAQAIEREAAAGRLAAEVEASRIKDTIIEAQKVELKNKGGGLQDKLKTAAISGVVVATVFAVFGRR